MRDVPLIRVVVDAVLLGLVWLPIPVMFVHLQPFQRGFFCSDISIRYPYKEGTVSSAMLYSVGTIFPTITIAVVEAYRIYFLEPRAFHGGERLKPRYSLLGRHIPPFLASLYIYLGYFYFGMAINVLLTDLGKYTIGRLRPHFLDVCKPDLTTHCGDPYAYVTPEQLNCTGPPAKVRAARVSFPSGHASFSAYTMIYLILYVQSRMIWSVGGLLTKHVLQFIALLLAVSTALSRISDFKHHWSDVLSGFILGAIVATAAAFCMSGLFRRPQCLFARPSPYDTREYSGGQLFGEFCEDAKASEHASSTIIEHKEPV